ncbi:hypothetical protein PCAR4_140055 [Paraburkholderia caribensis]|nr:hypothetical protein PCAR4_140055 [Paraburkholderia caribensis]
MDLQIDYAAGMPIGLLDEMPTPVDATEWVFSAAEDSLPEHSAAGVVLTNMPL